MDFGLVLNVVIGALALFRVVLFALFCRVFREGEELHPIYRQGAPPATGEPESLQLKEPVERAA